MRLKINVTAQDIENGARWSRWASPIAIAIRSHFPGQSVWITAGIAYAGTQRAKLPPVAQDFLGAFSFGRPVQPFSFYLDFYGLSGVPDTESDESEQNVV